LQQPAAVAAHHQPPAAVLQHDAGPRRQSSRPPRPPAPQPSAEQHVVVVANHNAPYWERLAQTLANTRKTYAGLQDTTPPPFEVGILPKAVVYRNNIPVRIVTGEHDVENLLYRLGRGEPI
jgi:hypothetical protein